MIERLRVRVPAGAAGEFSSPELTVYVDSYWVSVPPPVTAVARKRPRSFCKKCRWQVTPKHACTSQLAEPLWTNPGIMSGKCVCEPISTLKNKNKKRRPRLNGGTSSQNSCKRGKSHQRSPILYGRSRFIFKRSVQLH